MRLAKMRVGFVIIEKLLNGRWLRQCKHTTAPVDLKVIAIEPAAPPCVGAAILAALIGG